MNVDKRSVFNRLLYLKKIRHAEAEVGEKENGRDSEAMFGVCQQSQMSKKSLGRDFQIWDYR